VVEVSHSVFNADGLNTTANPIASVAKGSAAIADNCVVREKDIYESRRGQALSSASFGNVYDRANNVFFFEGTPLFQYGESFLTRYDGSTFTDVAGVNTPPAPDVLRMKSAQANEKFFFTTDTGIKVLDSPDGTPRAAGIGKPFSFSAVKELGASGNWFAKDNQTSFRVLFGKRDERGGVQEGPPSETSTVVIPAADPDPTWSIRVSFLIPEGITTDHFYRVYMTDPTGAEGVVPDEEFYLLYEGRITAAILAGEGEGPAVSKLITETESVTSDIPLYTNPNTGNGIESAKHPAPYARDLCYWDHSLWAFGVKRKQTIRLTLLGVDAANGGTGLYPEESPTITINGTTYTFAEDLYASGAHEILAETDLATPSANIATTANAIAFKINGADENLRAYYVPKADGWPGEIVIEEAGQGGEPFTIYGDANSYQAFSPELPLTAETAISSTADDFPHWAWHTPVEEPEAWPLANFIPIGKRGATILRGVPMKDGLYCFRDDATIQVIRGAGGQYRVDELDSTAQVVGPDTVCTGNNQIFALTSQGICTVGEGGVGVIGLPIEADVRSLFGPTLETTKLISFGFVYETERSYIIGLPTRAGQTVCQQVFVYNYFTKAWTRWPMARTCGGVNPLTDLLYMGDGDANQVRIERKTLTQEDFADEAISDELQGVDGLVLSVNDVSNYDIGDMVEQGTSRAVVTAVDRANFLATMSGGTWTATTATVYRGIPCELQWSPATMGAPGVEKTWSGFHLHFGEACFVNAEATLTTEKSAEPGRMKEMQRLGWGLGGWGEFPWGNPTGPCNERMDAPLDKRSAAYFHPRFYIREAKSAWKLLGYTIDHEPISPRTSK
jgi:hypothetical protein